MNERRIIPLNYDYWGSKIANIIETIIIDGILILIMVLLDLGFKFNLYFGVLLLPATIFGFMGVNNQSLFTALYNYIIFLRRRRVLEEPTPEYIRKKDKAMLKKKRKEGK